MKYLTLLFLLSPALHLNAQKSIPSNNSSSVKPDIEKVVSDYYDHFHNIKGEKIDETKSTIEYSSKVLPQGAIESSITEIKSLHNVFSWQATMMDTDDYNVAVEEYKKLYRQLNEVSIKMHDKTIWEFRGSYDIPDEGRPFASTILEPDIQDKVLRRLKIEIALNYSLPDWTVKLIVYEKVSDEDIRPTQIDQQ
jgi:hypothetical protein